MSVGDFGEGARAEKVLRIQLRAEAGGERVRVEGQRRGAGINVGRCIGADVECKWQTRPRHRIAPLRIWVPACILMHMPESA